MNPRSYKSIQEQAKKCKNRGELMRTVIAAFRGKLPEERSQAEKEITKPSTPNAPSSVVIPEAVNEVRYDLEL